MVTFLTILEVLISIALIVVVLLMDGKSAGLSGAIGGGAETLFGKHKGINKLLNKASTVCAALFLLITLLLAIIS